MDAGPELLRGRGGRSECARWAALAAFALLVAASQLLWLTFSPITQESAAAFGVSVAAVGDLAVLQPLLYVALAVPAGRWADRSFGAALATGAVLTATGAVIRTVDPSSFTWALAGQGVAALGQPLVLNATTQVAARWFGPGERTGAISVGSAAQFVGILVAVLAGRPLYDGGGLGRLLTVQAGVAVVAAIAVLVAVRLPASFPGTRLSDGSHGLAWLRGNRMLRRLAGLLFIGVGSFNAVATWLDAILSDLDVRADAGRLVGVTTAAGIVGAAVLPTLAARYDRRRTLLLTTTAALVVVFPAVALLAGTRSAPGLIAVLLGALGFLLLAGLPVALDWAELEVGPDRAATATAVLLLAGNVGGAVLVLLVQALVDDGRSALLALSLVALPGVLLVAGLPRRVQGPVPAVAGPGGDRVLAHGAVLAGRYPGRVTPLELSTAIRAALAAAVEAGELAVSVPDEVRVDRPKQRDHGDWATSLALQLAKQAGRPPREVATVLAERLSTAEGIKSVEVAGPGFLNIVLDAAAAGELARTILANPDAYGRSEIGAGQRVNLEFVSANPTGPIHLGGTRWAAVGDSLARIIDATGAQVTREYYFNDHGAQIDRFARSLLASALGRPVPEDGYAGQYIDDIAAAVLADVAAAGEPDPRTLPAEQAQEVFRSRGVDRMFGEIKATLHDFGVDFDVYFHENDLHASGAVDRAVARLRELGRIYESEGATWLRTTDFGDDKDRVVIKSDGNPAYISGDLAYYLDKRERGFDRVIIMLGADHHGYIGRLMAMCAAFGDTPHVNLEILIGQMVNLVKDGEPVRMSKRNGTVIALEDLVEAVGVDAARYALARSSADSSIDVDLDLLVKRTNDNPVYYVQYAHARICGVVRNAVAAGVRREDAFAPALLTHEADSALLAALGEFPRTVAQAAELREPHRVARYLEELAGHFHRWYDATRVTPRPDEQVDDGHRTRLWVAEATRVVLANGLRLLGVSAPERM